MHNDETDVCPCEMCSPKVRVTSRHVPREEYEHELDPTMPMPGERVDMMIHIAPEATEGDVRHALAQYPAAVDETVRLFHQLRGRQLARRKIEA